MKTVLTTLLATALMSSTMLASAGSATVKITEVYSNQNGEILFRTSQNGALTDPGCNGDWISLKDEAKEIMFRSLLTAKATNSDVWIRAYCTGTNYPYVNIMTIK